MHITPLKLYGLIKQHGLWYIELAIIAKLKTINI